MRRARFPHRLAVSACLLAAWLLADSAATARPSGTQAPAAVPLPLTLPNKPDSLKFGVMGDFGTGRPEQYRLAEQMERVRSQFPFTLMLTDRKSVV